LSVEQPWGLDVTLLSQDRLIVIAIAGAETASAAAKRPE
jgi:hypothetical protein